MIINKFIRALFFLVIFTSCNNITMTDIYRENLPDSAKGYVTKIEYSKGGDGVLTIYESSGRFNKIGVDKTFRDIVRTNDYFIKQANTNKCTIERNDSIIYLDCYDIPKEIRDSLGSIEEWPSNKKGYWHLRRLRNKF